jgi:hypothetical protein
MSSKLYVVVALLIYLGVLGYFSVKAALPKKEEVIVSETQKITEESFKSPVLQEMRTYTQFGNLPVTIDKNEQGKENPFK